VALGGQFGTFFHGRFGVLAAQAWTRESMIGIGEAPLFN